MLGLGVSVMAQERSIITFDAPHAGTTGGQGTLPWGIVQGGWIMGNYIDGNGVYYGFLRAPDGSITEFDVPGMGTNPGQGAVEVFGMTPGLEIVGDYLDSNNAYHGFIRTPRGKFTTFECPGAGAGGTAAEAVNPAGLISAMYLDENSAWHGCLRAADGTFTDYDPPDAGTASWQGTYASIFSGINPEGEVVGEYLDNNWVWHGYVRTPRGAITEFNDPNAGTGVDSGQGTLTLGIDPAGEIWGTYMDPNYVFHGYLRSPHGSFTEVDVRGAGTDTFQGTCACWPIPCFGGINAAGTVTGSYLDGNYVMHGFLRTPDGKIVTFDAPGAGSTPGTSSSTWYQGTQAAAINSDGAITGYYTDAHNVVHGFLRLPMP
jgi:hypothetical protein